MKTGICTQLISSLLAMHGREFGDAGPARAFEQCQERVQAIARVHEHMYQSSDLHEMSFSEHLRALTLEVRATGAPPPGVELVLDIGERVVLRVDQAIPCAMIVHELLVNAFKHAFPLGRQGLVRVSCHEEGEGIVAVSVQDDGVGMTSLTGAKGTGLGWTLVDAFVRQLGAKLEFDISAGTRVRLSFAGARAPLRRAPERNPSPARPGPAPARDGRAAARVEEAEVS